MWLAGSASRKGANCDKGADERPDEEGTLSPLEYHEAETDERPHDCYTEHVFRPFADDVY